MRNNKLWLRTILWIVGMLLSIGGMTALCYGFNPTWWPAFLNVPGVCLVWFGVFAYYAEFLISMKED